MNRQPRNPLEKQRFLGGNRQKWALVLIMLAGGVLVANIYNPHIQPSPYLGFLTTVGAVFLIGMSADSVMKIQKTPASTLNDEESN